MPAKEIMKAENVKKSKKIEKYQSLF